MSFGAGEPEGGFAEARGEEHQEDVREDAAERELVEEAFPVRSGWRGFLDRLRGHGPEPKSD